MDDDDDDDDHGSPANNGRVCHAHGLVHAPLTACMDSRRDYCKGARPSVLGAKATA
jgi:hypothetical protein